MNQKQSAIKYFNLDRKTTTSDTYLVMHAYLIVGNSENKIAQEVKKLTEKLKASILEFPIAKIDDVRNLNSFVKLSLNKKTAILIKNVENATAEALNAFLKNLEEPQENLYYILTSTSVYKVLPTIVSRCQVIKITNHKSQITNKETEKFIEMSTASKLAFLDKLKNREDAANFVYEIICYLHSELINKGGNYGQLSRNISWANLTLERLKANGNVNLHLTNLAINFH